MGFCLRERISFQKFRIGKERVIQERKEIKKQESLN
jgi:hypothetical protein